MIFVKEYSDLVSKFHKEPPHVGTPFVENVKEPAPFYRNDPESSRMIAGYRKGPKNSYTRELAKRFPLTGK